MSIVIKVNDEDARNILAFPANIYLFKVNGKNV